MITCGKRVLGVVKVIVAGVLVGLMPAAGYPQVDSTLLRRVSCFSVGIVAGIQGSDSGIGLEATSPPFLAKRLSIRVRGALNWLNCYKAQTGHEITYPSLGIAMVYQTPITQRVRFYFEAGPFLLLPSDSFSDRNNAAGFSGTAGVELFARYKTGLMISYFFGGGLASCNARAEKLENQPEYGSGFVFTNGLRLYF